MKKIRTGMVTCFLLASGCILAANNIFNQNDEAQLRKLEYIKKAEYHEENKAYITAAEYYAKAVECEPQNTGLMLKTAENMLLCGDDENFEKYCRMAEELGDAEAYKAEIRNKIDEKDAKGAYQIFSELDEMVYDEELRELEMLLKYSYEESLMSYEDMKGFRNGVTAVRSDGKWGLADREGYPVCECIFDDAGAYCSEEDIFPVCSGDEWYFADEKGNRKYVPERRYSFLGAYSEGYAPFSDGKKYGYMTLDYEEKNLIYDFAGAFSDGVAAVSENGKWYLIGNDLKKISEEEYDCIQTDKYGFCSENGMIRAVKNGKTETIYTDRASHKASVNSSLDLKVFSENDKFGYKNESGYIAIDPSFDEAFGFSDSGSACVRKGDSWYVLRLINYPD